MRIALLLAALSTLCSWLLPNHYYPWTSFFQDFAAFIALAFLALALAARDERIHATHAAVVACAVAIIPAAQALSDTLLTFAGDGWVAAAYLMAFAFACAIGSASANLATPARFATQLAIVALVGALLSGVIALYQWLGSQGADIYIAQLPIGGRPGANLGQPNNHATLLCLGLAATLYLFTIKKLGSATTLLLATYLIIGIAMAQSRTSWLCAMFLLAWWGWKGRSATRLGGIAILAGLCVYVALVWFWPDITAAFDSVAHGRQRAAEVGVRGLLWTQLLDAATRSPWLGYGWNQVSVAQIAVAAEYPQTVMVEHSHNLFIDLLIWNGIPLGLLLIFAICAWGFTRLKNTRTPESWFAMLAIGFLFIHGMLEFPLEYAYFLLPLGLLIGLVDADQSARVVLRIPRALLWGVIAAGVTMMAVVWQEYRLIEEDHRLMRFESARIGTLAATRPAPDVVVLSQLREFLRFARTKATPGMSADEVEWMRKVAHRYPYPPALFRYALALGMNGAPEAARLEMKRLRQLHGEELYLEARAGLQSLAETTNPELAAVLVEDVPQVIR